jgi:acyl-CoA dehydrogenase
MMTFPVTPQEDRDEFRSALRGFLAARSPRDQVRGVVESGAAVDVDVWQQSARELGLQGLLVPEALGGSGAGPDIASDAAAELGAALVPGPYVSALVAGTLLADCGADTAARQLAAGDLRVAVDMQSLATPVVVDAGTDDSVVLDGIVRRVPDVLGAEALLVAVRVADELRLVLVRLDDVEVVPLRSMDLVRPVGEVHLSGVIGSRPVEVEVVDRAFDLAGILLGAEQTAVIDRVLRDDVAYFLDREAFGRKVGSYQAVKHQAARIYCVWEQASALLEHSLAVFSDGNSRRTAVDTLQCFVAPAAVQATTDGLRLLGGIGFTWEHDAHLYFRRARADESLLENIHHRRSRLSRAIGLREPAVPA